MKYLKKIFLWICISLVIQCIIFYLADRYIMVKEDVRIFKMNLTDKEEDSSLDINIKADSSWENINCSYDGKYISYTSKGKLYTYNTYKNITKEVPFEANQKLAYYMWIPERERMLIIEKKSVDKDLFFSISYYDANNNEKKNVKEISQETENSIINDVEVSLLTGIIYINITTEDTNSSLYRIDISENILSIDTENLFIDKLSLVESMDRLLYEDKLYNKIFYIDFPSNKGEKVIINHKSDESDEWDEEAMTGDNLKPLKDKYVDSLLGSNDLGEVYVGKNINGYISTIYNTEGDLKLANWNTNKLKIPVKKENIFICDGGGFYVIYENEKKIIYYNKKIEITKELYGKVISFYNKGYLYINSDNRIINEQVLD